MATSTKPFSCFLEKIKLPLQIISKTPDSEGTNVTDDKSDSKVFNNS
jgi:hypothetical protein